jgi:hypothetical protein
MILSKFIEMLIDIERAHGGQHEVFTMAQDKSENIILNPAESVFLLKEIENGKFRIGISKVVVHESAKRKRTLSLVRG